MPRVFAPLRHLHALPHSEALPAQPVTITVTRAVETRADAQSGFRESFS